MVNELENVHKTNLIFSSKNQLRLFYTILYLKIKIKLYFITCNVIMFV